MKVILSLDEITRVLLPYVSERYPGFAIGPNDGKPSFLWIATGDAVRLEVTLEPCDTPDQKGSSPAGVAVSEPSITAAAQGLSRQFTEALSAFESCRISGKPYNGLGHLSEAVATLAQLLALAQLLGVPRKGGS